MKTILTALNLLLSSGDRLQEQTVIKGLEKDGKKRISDTCTSRGRSNQKASYPAKNNG